MILTRDEIAALVRATGCPESVVPTAVAVCLAESGGDTNATNTNEGGNAPGSIDRGLWQINNHWHPEVDDVCAYNAECATREAARISSRWTNLNPWNAYKSGAYLKHLEPSTMEIIQRKTIYYTPAAHRLPPLGIVLHNTVTRTLVAPHNQGSWHYEIDRDGQVYQYVNDLDYAWHVRACDEWRPHWIKQRSGTVSEANSCTVGIELVSYAGATNPPPEPGYQAYTDAQYLATSELLSILYAKYGTLPIVTHGSLQLDRTDPVSLDLARVGLVWAGDGYRYIEEGEDMATIAELQGQIDQLNGVNTELQRQLDYCQQLKQEVEAGLTQQVMDLNQRISELLNAQIQVVKEYPVASHVEAIFPDGTRVTLPSAP